jgi:hypothetical protein
MSNFLNPNGTYPANWPALQVGRWSGAELHSEPTGLAATVEKFSGYYNDLVRNINLNLLGGGTVCRSYLSPHPDFPSLLAYGIKIVRRPGVINGLLSIEYRGLDPALSYPPPPIYTIEVTTGNEPLATHPLWTSAIAGTGTVPLNGAQWVSYDKTGANYNPAPPAGNPGTYQAANAVFFQWLNGSIFTGIEDYLAAGIVYKKAYTTIGSPGDLSDVGTFSDPDGPVPNLPDSYDWFYLGITSEDNAGLYRNSASWKAVPTGDAANIIYGG